MDKYWRICDKSGRLLQNNKYKTFDEAANDAKKLVGSYGDVHIMELVAVAKQPVPDVEVVKL